MGITYICGMETKLDNIYMNSVYGVSNYEYAKANISKDYIKEIAFVRERERMGGDKGIHLTLTNTEEDGN
jgi:hypothetical protein